MTHILYSENKGAVIYFSGIYEDRFDENGIYAYIEWDWNEDINRATVLCTTDAWQLWNKARTEFKGCKIEVQRVMELKDIVYETV